RRSSDLPTPRPCTATGPGPDPSTAAQANHSHAGLIGLNTGLPGYSYALSLGGSASEGDYFSEMSFLMGWGPSLRRKTSAVPVTEPTMVVGTATKIALVIRSSRTRVQ